MVVLAVEVVVVLAVETVLVLVLLERLMLAQTGPLVLDFPVLLALVKVLLRCSLSLRFLLQCFLVLLANVVL